MAILTKTSRAPGTTDVNKAFIDQETNLQQSRISVLLSMYVCLHLQTHRYSYIHDLATYLTVKPYGTSS